MVSDILEFSYLLLLLLAYDGKFIKTGRGDTEEREEVNGLYVNIPSNIFLLPDSELIFLKYYLPPPCPSMV